MVPVSRRDSPGAVGGGSEHVRDEDVRDLLAVALPVLTVLGGTPERGGWQAQEGFEHGLKKNQKHCGVGASLFVPVRTRGCCWVRVRNLGWLSWAEADIGQLPRPKEPRKGKRATKHCLQAKNLCENTPPLKS